MLQDDIRNVHLLAEDLFGICLHVRVDDCAGDKELHQKRSAPFHFGAAADEMRLVHDVELPVQVVPDKDFEVDIGELIPELHEKLHEPGDGSFELLNVFDEQQVKLVEHDPRK